MKECKHVEDKTSPVRRTHLDRELGLGPGSHRGKPNRAETLAGLTVDNTCNLTLEQVRSPIHRDH
jgi:hypothetical protein